MYYIKGFPWCDKKNSFWHVFLLNHMIDCHPMISGAFHEGIHGIAYCDEWLCETIDVKVNLSLFTTCAWRYLGPFCHVFSLLTFVDTTGTPWHVCTNTPAWFFLWFSWNPFASDGWTKFHASHGKRFARNSAVLKTFLGPARCCDTGCDCNGESCAIGSVDGAV